MIKEISDLRQLRIVSKRCKFTDNGCFLEPKSSQITIHIDEPFDKVILHLKRVSGNGSLVINGKSTNVLSTISEIIVIQEKTIDIQRLRDSIGEICIFGLSIYAEGEHSLMQNWKAIMARCGNYESICLVNGKLFASSGAYIEDASVIKSIETDPLNVAQIRDGKMVFSLACEITKVELAPSALLIPKKKMFADREPAAPLIINPESAAALVPAERTAFIRSPHKTTDHIVERFIYDSDTFREFNSAKRSNAEKTYNIIKSNGKDFLKLKNGGSYPILASFVVPNQEYTILIEGTCLSGGGKLLVGFTNAKNHQNVGEMKSTTIKAGEIARVQVNSEKIPLSGDGLRLVLMLPKTQIGEILISRVRILDPNFPHTYVSASDIRYSVRPPPYVFEKGVSKRFVIVIPSYNNAKWCQANIESAINQNYDKYRVIFTDDASTDGTFEKVYDIVKDSGKMSKCTLTKNTQRFGALGNLYNMIHSCDDDEIILTLDGDDWFPDENVLAVLNEVYSNHDIWLTYGQYQNYPDQGRGIAQKIPDKIIDANAFRTYQWCSSHLRTFYAWLFKSIKETDLMENGKFFSMTWDMAMMFPMLEMAGHRSKFIPDFLYVYNMDNPINDHKVNVQLQQNLDRQIRSMPRYQRLEKPIGYSESRSSKGMTSVGLMLIATGKYHHFIQGLIASADNYFLNEPKCAVTYYIFTDKHQEIRSRRPVVQLPIDHRPFPFASMDRFRHFTNYADSLISQNYLYYVDVDCQFVDYVSREILGNLVGVRHCGFINREGPYEPNPLSNFYVENLKKYKWYFGGGFSGGRTGSYLELSKWCADTIDKDIDSGIVPIWHDETAINRYFLDHEPDVVLTPSYHFPQSNLDRYKIIWGENRYLPKIVLLDKRHDEIRFK